MRAATHDVPLEPALTPLRHHRIVIENAGNGRPGRSRPHESIADQRQAEHTDRATSCEF